jgi:hypothetical protein
MPQVSGRSTVGHTTVERRVRPGSPGGQPPRHDRPERAQSAHLQAARAVPRGELGERDRPMGLEGLWLPEAMVRTAEPAEIRHERDENASGGHERCQFAEHQTRVGRLWLALPAQVAPQYLGSVRCPSEVRPGAIPRPFHPPALVPRAWTPEPAGASSLPRRRACEL